jgi:5'-3' exonuclease
MSEQHTNQERKKLFLLDAYALIFRAFYAFIKNPRINSKGMILRRFSDLPIHF